MIHGDETRSKNSKDETDPLILKMLGKSSPKIMKEIDKSSPKMMDMISPEELENPDIVSSFAKAAAVAEPTVKEVKIDDNTIKISYERPAKLFGFMPVKYKLTAEGDSQTGKIKAKKPWWLLFTKNDAGKFIEAFQKINSESDPDEMESMELNKLINKRGQAIQILSKIIKSYSETQKSIITNIK